MENLGLVKIEQDTSSADTSVRNALSSVGCDLSNNRSGPSASPNGISSFSGKASPAVIPGEVDLLASFLQDTERCGDSEILKNCEARWLHFFRLVGKQCQEQIVAQQKHFYQQLHHIQNEIRHLVKVQHQNACSCADRSSPAKCANTPFSLKPPMGLQSETFEKNELSVHQLKANKAENQLEASECRANSVSMSSGYGTCSATELSPDKAKDIRACMENTGGITSGQDSVASTQKALVTAVVQNKKEFAHSTVEHGLPLKDTIALLAESTLKISEGRYGGAGCKSLTSWAQKLKQTQLKRTNAEEEVHSADGKEQTKTLPFEITSPPAAVPSYPFYLSQPSGSQNSLVSDISGLTYWKLDEKETYLSLPENFGNEFNTYPATVSPEQSSSGDEVKPSSLKEIYHKKQRESKQLADWNFSPSQSTHPPEILTLDPTLHMKPGQQSPGLAPHSFYRTPEEVPFSPDSMADPAFFIHSDPDSFSRMSSVTSPQSADSPKYASSTTAFQVDPWNGCAFQNEAEGTSGFYPVAFSHPSHHISNTEDEDNLTLKPSSAAQSQLPSGGNSLAGYSVSLTCAEDPVMLSKIRQNLREKHARHIADLRAYYDSEIQSLKQQLEISHKLPFKDLKKINQSLADRCDQLQATLNDTNNRMRALENKNNALEMEVTDWRERFSIVSSTTKALREQAEEVRAGSKEKDNTISRLKRRLKDLEEAFEKAHKLSDNKDARLRAENNMFQNLLGEYESLGKEHERVKDTLNVTENKLIDAHAQISDLKRTVSKLEAQIMQLEHENLQKFRHLADCHVKTPSANSKRTNSDVSRRKWLIPGAEYSIFTGQPLEGDESPKDNRLEDAYAAYRNHSPPEKDSSPDPSLTNEMEKKEREMPEAPILKAVKELEERKASKSWGTQTEKEGAAPTSKSTSRRLTVGFDEASLAASRSPEKGKDRHKRYSSPCGQRSSSLPPSNRKSNTPTRREIMLAPAAVTCSPKRSPKENLSPGFSYLLSRNENTVTRFDILLDELENAPPASQHSNPRKRLQFLSIGDTEETQHHSPGKDGRATYPPRADSLHAGAERGAVGPVRGEEISAPVSEPIPPSAVPAYTADVKYVSRIKTLAETEKLFDELTHEKQQIEAQLSRIPGTGVRMTLQARLNQEALEDRLERINRELGSIRMILKKFHVLRTSANT